MPFTVSRITDDSDLKEIYRLRYKVYCEEWGFEKPEDHIQGIEKDEFDKNSVHFAARDSSGKLVGTIRLILNSPEGYPIEKHCSLNINPDELPRDNLSEISRLAISKDYRQRAEDKFIYGPDEERRSIGSFDFDDKYGSPSSKFYYRRAEDKFRPRTGFRRTGDSSNNRRVKHEPVLSLYKAMYRESKKRQITHSYAVTAKGLQVLIRRYFGFRFEAIGDPVDYHGIRIPYLGEIKKIDEGFSEKNPDLFEEFNRDL
jgi:N-acyl-L-homoserine lactone synthetase